MNINTDCHLLPMEGAYNIRDLGGYPAEIGGVTRKGLFFRADNTANLTPKDVDLLREKGLVLHRPYVGRYACSMEMQGMSLSLMKLDDELKRLLDAPADSPFFKQF